MNENSEHSKRQVPEQPLIFIQQCVRERKLKWTYHVNMRLKGRFISRAQILNSVDHYEIIESYPDDKYLPSYLVYARDQEHVFHILFATDVAGDNVRVITTYMPSSEEWAEDFRTRRV